MCNGSADHLSAQSLLPIFAVANEEPEHDYDQDAFFEPRPFKKQLVIAGKVLKGGRLLSARTERLLRRRNLGLFWRLTRLLEPREMI